MNRSRPSMGSSGISVTQPICIETSSQQENKSASSPMLVSEALLQVVLMASTAQKVDTKPEPEKTTNGDTKEVSQEGFDYVLHAMNGEDNMKEEAKDYKPTKTWGSYFFGSSKK